MADTPKAVSIFDGCKYICAEQLHSKAATLTIKAITPKTIVGDGGREAEGFEMSFAETPKMYAFACSTNRRALMSIFSTEDYRVYVGKRIKLYPAKSGKGLAIRIAAAD